jgi:hypothetical protein
VEKNMNKRIIKKKFKMYHRGFCHVSYDYERGLTTNKYSEPYQCPNCGWDSLNADEDLGLGKILWSSGGFYDYEFEIEYKCPCCNTVFNYVDGS